MAVTARPRPEAPGPRRRLPVGAEALEGGVHFRVHAPLARRIEVAVEGGPTFALDAEGGGYFAGHRGSLGPGTLYRYRVNGEGPWPDPASRFQPDGPHGPSQVVDPGAYRWADADWRGARLERQVIYELHVGTFTREGTMAAAARELRELAEAGITCIELMPLADYPGRFGWGYDGVSLFAPSRNYGTPDDVRRFVDRAHALGLAVILDVVYNHFGPSGNYTGKFSPHFVSTRHTTEWGDAVNYDDANAAAVREFVVANAGYWIDEFHFDGLRLDATQSIFDDSPEHILTAVGRRVREAARGRETIVVAENEEQVTRLVRPPAQGGYGLDGLWNDDFHHAACVALTGRAEAYYTDYRGTSQEIVSALKWGYLFQGQRYAWQKKRRGSSTAGLPASVFVNYLENHDQVSNVGTGRRLWQLCGPGRLRAMTAVLLLAPSTPLLFQGQEFCSSAPFLFFADHEPDLARLVLKGRREFLSQFPSVATMVEEVPDPADPETFEACKLDFGERVSNAPFYRMTRDLLALRAGEPAFDADERDHFDGAVLSEAAFVLRYFHHRGDRILVVNLGRDLHYSPAPEPLLAPWEGRRWERLWSSEAPEYGGLGTPEPESEDEGWRIPGHAALLLRPAADGSDDEGGRA